MWIIEKSQFFFLQLTESKENTLTVPEFTKKLKRNLCQKSRNNLKRIMQLT